MSVCGGSGEDAKASHGYTCREDDSTIRRQQSDRVISAVGGALPRPPRSVRRTPSCRKGRQAWCQTFSDVRARVSISVTLYLLPRC